MTATEAPIDRADAVLDRARLSLRDGIHVSNAIDQRTVWDRLATEDPIQAVISAENPEAARAKSAEQLREIEARVDADTVLVDVGCGYGRIAQYLLPERRIGLYVGVDSAFAMLRIFRNRYDASPDERRTQVAFVNSDITSLPLIDGSVDIAVVSAVFLHNHKTVVRQAMAQIERVLKPGGTLLVFSSFPRRATAMGLQGTLHQLYLDARGVPLRNGPVRYYSRREVSELLRGFSRSTIIPHDFEVVPKSIIGMPARIDAAYRRYFSGPLNRLLAKLLGGRWQPAFARHYDVVARK